MEEKNQLSTGQPDENPSMNEQTSPVHPEQTSGSTAPKQDDQEEEQDKVLTRQLLSQVNPEVLESYTREQIVKLLEELIREVDIKYLVGKLPILKEAFENQIEKEEQELLEQHSRSGSLTYPYAKKDPLVSRFKELYNIFEDRKLKYLEERKEEEKKSIAERKAVLEEMEKILQNEQNLKEAFEKFHELQQRWKKAGRVRPALFRELNEQYRNLTRSFYYNVRINRELKELHMQKNLEERLRLIEQMKRLATEENDINKLQLEVEAIKHDWDEIDMVPPDKHEETRKAFREATAEVYRKIRAYYKQIKEEQKENLNKKIELCEQVEAFVAELPDTAREWQKKTKQLLIIQEQYRQIGRVPVNYRRRVWKRFRKACNQFFKAKAEFFENLKQQVEENRRIKEAICEKAENLKDSIDWYETTEALKKLQKEWTKTGPAGREHDQQLWERFRAACDYFFERKREAHAKLLEVEKENLKLKEQLLEELEKFEPSGDPVKDKNALLDFKNRWKAIGNTPSKSRRKLAKQFSDLINKKFESVKIPKEQKALISYESKLERFAASPDSKRKLFNEKRYLTREIKNLKHTLETYQTNLERFSIAGDTFGFLAVAKNNIESTKQELAFFEKKLKTLNKYLEQL